MFEIKIKIGVKTRNGWYSQLSFAARKAENPAGPRLLGISHLAFPPASVGAASYNRADQSVAEDNWVWVGQVYPPRSMAHHSCQQFFLQVLELPLDPMAQSPRAREVM